MPALYILYESASGYGLFEHTGTDELNLREDNVVNDLKKFSSVVKLKGFVPFTSAENALDEINHISEGEPTQNLINFLEMNLPAATTSSSKKKKDKSSSFTLGVSEPKLGAALGEVMNGIKCVSNDTVMELLRGIRLYFHRYINVLKESDLRQAQLGLSHSYSRSKVKFNVHRVDNMIIQSIALLDQLDKDLNTFAMRVKEWYGWHFPELSKIVNDNYEFARLAVCIKNRSNDIDTLLPEIEEILNHDTIRAGQVIEAAKHSMGQDISPVDMINIQAFASRVVALAEYRKRLHHYLIEKMNLTAPNLSALIGELVGARLIAHAGSLTSLAKYPASTVQILGAEKALFRALKTKGNTPKYGLIFHSSFIGRAAPNVKGRISRYLANKCSIASRIDNFSDMPTSIFGNKLKQQVEQRLEFYKSGAQPRKNADVMSEAMKEFDQTVPHDDITMDGELDLASSAASTPSEKKKKDKKEKEKKKDKKRHAEDIAASVTADGEPSSKKKHKKDKSDTKKKKDKKHA